MDDTIHMDDETASCGALHRRRLVILKAERAWHRAHWSRLSIQRVLRQGAVGHKKWLRRSRIEKNAHLSMPARYESACMRLLRAGNFMKACEALRR